MATVIRLVKSGDWSTILPVSAVRSHIESGEIEIHEIVDPIITRQLSLIRRSDRVLEDRELQFIALLKRHLVLN